VDVSEKPALMRPISLTPSQEADLEVRGWWMRKFWTLGFLFAFILVSLTGCAEHEAELARTAQINLMGVSQTYLEACLGLPDQKVTDGKTTIFTYFANPTRTVNLSVPVFNTIGVSLAGYCHATFRLYKGHVMEVRYTGDTDTMGSKDSACAPIIRSCMETPERIDSR
jgi:hypothetical protein